eukprot:3307887-Ditylum_brightwellii.AAC.1
MLAKADTGASPRYWTHCEIQGLQHPYLMDPWLNSLTAPSIKQHIKEQSNYILHFRTRHNKLTAFQK